MPKDGRLFHIDRDLGTVHVCTCRNLKIQSALHAHDTQIALWGLGASEKEKAVAAKSRIIQDFQ